MFSLFLVAVTVVTYCVWYIVKDIVRYIGTAIAFTRTDSTVKKIDGINTTPTYIITVCVPFIIWYCWTH